MPKVYVVISDSIIQNYESHGLHGVFSTKSKAISVAISAIIGTAERNYHNITVDDICIDDLELSYQAKNLEIYVSCIEQEVR